MAIVQTQAQFRVMAEKVAIPKERADQIHAAGTASANVAALRAVMNRVCYPIERADHLVSAGVTFA
jgi:hypothetical protein